MHYIHMTIIWLGSIRWVAECLEVFKYSSIKQSAKVSSQLNLQTGEHCLFLSSSMPMLSGYIKVVSHIVIQSRYLNVIHYLTTCRNYFRKGMLYLANRECKFKRINRIWSFLNNNGFWKISIQVTALIRICLGYLFQEFHSLVLQQ